MHRIHLLVPDGEREVRITDVIATTTSLVEAVKSTRPLGSTKAKNRLRQSFAELAELKAMRSMSMIHRLDYASGLGDLA